MVDSDMTAPKEPLATQRQPGATTRTAWQGAPSECDLGGGNLPCPVFNIPPVTDRRNNNMVLPTWEDCLAALRAMPAADRRRLIAEVTRHRIRPDYRRYTFISTAEAMDLTGMAEQTIHNAVAAGRIQRSGSGKFSLEQSSVLKAFAKRKASA